MSVEQSSKLDPTSLGLALGVIWAGGIAALGLIARIGWGEKLHGLFADLYIGYDDTTTGILIGAIWGFADALVGGVLVGWLYNTFMQDD